MNDLLNLEFQIAGLKLKIAQRKSQAANAPSEGGLSNPGVFIEASEKALRALAVDYITIKCQGRGWDPLDILERMARP